MLTINPKPAGEDSDGKPQPPKEHEKIAAVIIHLAGVFWLPLLPMPMLALVVPFIALQFARVHSDFAEQHAVQACNFQMLMGCFYVLAMLAGFALKTPLFIWWVGIGSALFCMWQAARAINGWPAKYPVTLKVFK
ncbi:DUF4870 domain-containing protein [Chitinibacter bivalviorum]|uniref:DUF4870 domain-containing protein n=1 Tax=Chitinibacter bivalviorum TaxID=2739434 RepID=A0A7H9BKM9_9NEIS|nr:DUF4870 domain-containing protein [Chitinibacter bivalviorum]QLG88818.1 DUF4870 domain-containing protein [Chitinibacter bivalviorum]